MSYVDELEGKKQQAKTLMDKLPGPTDTLWMFLGGGDLPKKESEQLWEYIESLKEDEK